MTVHVLTGSKQEIAAKVAALEGDFHEAIVFVEDPWVDGAPPENIFVEMEPFTVRQAETDDSRDALYRRMEGE